VPPPQYCHNVLSSRPTEFLTLPAGSSTNFSFLPSGGSISSRPEHNHLATRFTKLRVCPWLLVVKTDDYSFSSSQSRRGGTLIQSYWNGERVVAFNDVPYATARNSNGPMSGGHLDGFAAIDLQGTEFGVRFDGFRPMGCSAWGRVVVLVPPGTAEPVKEIRSRPVRQRVFLRGGGFAGRMTPIRDVTRSEVAINGNYDNEGVNGGWVLPLERFDAAAADNGEAQGAASTMGPAPSGRHALVLVPLDGRGDRVQGLQPVFEWRELPPNDAQVTVWSTADAHGF
jgi:hypothetical protein